MNALPPKTIEVSAGLVFRQGRLLVTRRPPEVHLAGLWEFPGGKREAGETFEDCLHRELNEELGIEVELLDLFDTVLHSYPEKTVRIQFFRCAWRRHEPRAIGCAELAWITRTQLVSLEFPPADARLLERLGASAELWA